MSVTAERSDGGIVDAEIIRPRSWILANGLCAGRMLPLNLPELEVSGLALVHAIDDCPPIACGEGSVVTARFVTREVHVVASVDVLGADGSVETITGTTIHPVWSVDRQEWVPLSELAEGERLQGLDGLAVVLGISLSRVSQPVYNIEVHGEHVYQVGELGLVVHNSCHHIVSYFPNINRGWSQAWSQMGQRILSNAGIDVHSVKNKVDLLIHQGPHPEIYHQRVFERLDQAVQGLLAYTPEYTAAVESELQAIAKILRSYSSALNGIGL